MEIANNWPTDEGGPKSHCQFALDSFTVNNMKFYKHAKIVNFVYCTNNLFRKTCLISKMKFSLFLSY